MNAVPFQRERTRSSRSIRQSNDLAFLIKVFIGKGETARQFTPVTIYPGIRRWRKRRARTGFVPYAALGRPANEARAHPFAPVLIDEESVPRPLASDMSKPSGPLQRLSPFAPAAKAVEPAVAFLRPAIRHGDAPVSAARTFASNEDSMFMSRCSHLLAPLLARGSSKKPVGARRGEHVKSRSGSRRGAVPTDLGWLLD